MIGLSVIDLILLWSWCSQEVNKMLNITSWMTGGSGGHARGQIIPIREWMIQYRQRTMILLDSYHILACSGMFLASHWSIQTISYSCTNAAVYPMESKKVKVIFITQEPSPDLYSRVFSQTEHSPVWSMGRHGSVGRFVLKEILPWMTQTIDCHRGMDVRAVLEHDKKHDMAEKH